MNQIGGIALRVMATTATVLLLYRLVDFAADLFAKRAERTESKFDDQIVPLVRKTSKVFVAVVGVIFVLQNLDVDVGSLLAGVSLGGLAFTLAAKDTVANLFGSVSIFADQPFQIGDWVVIDGHEGVIEEVGMRSTRIRTFYDSLITIPNSKVADAAIDNYGRRRFRRQTFEVGITYDSSVEQVEAFVEGIRAILKANPAVRKDAYEVHFRHFGASALQVFVYFFFQVGSWSDELRQRHNVLLEIMRLAKRVGVDFAFPTQTLHLETLATARTIEPRRAPDLAALTAAVAGHGPGGAHAVVDTPLLTDGFFPGAAQVKGDEG
ncbi:MAG: mechanosensitive ion channel family protein [Polyangiales bacterium]